MVACDDYELRIVTNTAKGFFKAVKAGVSAKDQKAGVSVSMKEESGLVRVTIKSPVSRDVAWIASF